MTVVTNGPDGSGRYAGFAAVRTRVPVAFSISWIGMPRLEVPPLGASTRFASTQFGAPALFDPLITPRARVPVTMAPPLSPARVQAEVAKPRMVLEKPES